MKNCNDKMKEDKLLLRRECSRPSGQLLAGLLLTQLGGPQQSPGPGCTNGVGSQRASTRLRAARTTKRNL